MVAATATAVDDGMSATLKAYGEACQDHRAVTDFRGKLLTLLPIASGAGIYVLLPKQGDPMSIAPAFLVAMGVFGALVTFGLFLHELRGIAQCGELIDVGRSLEDRLRISDGAFAKAYRYYHPPGAVEGFFNQLRGPVAAAWIIYPSVMAAWLLVAGLGIARVAG